jgi:UDP-glucose 4-epimerase
MTWRDSGVLVTGGAGFIGSHLVERVVAAGGQVTVVDNLSTGCLENLSNVIDRVDVHRADLLDVDWEEMLKRDRFDVILHLAANSYVPPSVERPAWDLQTNLVGTFRLLEVLRTLEWPGALVYASSAAVYGQGERMPIQEGDLTVPVSPYGVSKLAAERYVAVYSKLYGLRAASVRFFSVYGPRQRKQVVHDLIRKIMHNPAELFIYGDGSQVRDFNYVDDAVRAMMCVAERAPMAGEAYNVASGRACSIAELAETLCRVLNVRPKFVYSGSVRPGDPEKWVASIERLQQLGFAPQIRLEDGLGRTALWLLSECATSVVPDVVR